MSARVATAGTGIAGSSAAYRVAEAGLDPIVFKHLDRERNWAPR
jgi:flavin-dependent dehydrogenase